MLHNYATQTILLFAFTNGFPSANYSDQNISLNRFILATINGCSKYLNSENLGQVRCWYQSTVNVTMT